jgi:uncharacterized membrane protein SpoIIM required for sporulation
MKKEVKGYREARRFLYESRFYVYSVVGLFFFAMILAIVLPVPLQLEQQILNFISEIIEKTEGMDSIQLISFIFFNNLQSSFFAMIFGLFFGLFSLVSSFSNGYLLGFVSLNAIKTSGIFIMWRLFPHGIFELPAVFISMGLGLRIGYEFMDKCIRNYYPKISRLNEGFLIFISILLFPISFLGYLFFNLKEKKLRRYYFELFSSSLLVFILVILPLLVIAAIIEGLFISIGI